MTFFNGQEFSPFARIVVMYIEKVPNRNSPPAVLLRESYKRRRSSQKKNLGQSLKITR